MATLKNVDELTDPLVDTHDRCIGPALRRGVAYAVDGGELVLTHNGMRVRRPAERGVEPASVPPPESAEGASHVRVDGRVYHNRLELLMGAQPSRCYAFDRTPSTATARPAQRMSDGARCVVKRVGAREAAILTERAPRATARLLDTLVCDGARHVALEWVGADLGACMGEVRAAGRELAVARQLLEAVSHLHGLGVILGDVCKEHVLVHAGGVRLCGLSSATVGDERRRPTGKVCARAPELLFPVAHDERADAWSAGCLLVELFSGIVLWEGAEYEHDHLDAICDTFEPAIPLALNDWESTCRASVEAGSELDLSRVPCSAGRACVQTLLRFAPPHRRLDEALQAVARSGGVGKRPRSTGIE